MMRIAAPLAIEAHFVFLAHYLGAAFFRHKIYNMPKNLHTVYIEH